ncbi:MAG: prepilin-type N-terminal cleavage/methylation domain-containing protein [Solimonas sp.]
MRGFTLIEIMVVVIIVGVLITFATLAIGNRALSDRLETEARRLQQLFAMASEDAEMHGTEMGFVYTDQGYAFVAVGPNGRWMPLLDGPFRPRQVKAPIGLSLRVEGRVVPPTPLADLIAAGQAAKKLADRDQKKATEAAKSGDSSGSSSKKDDDDDKSKAKDDKDTEALKPQAMFLSSGEATAISIDVSARGVATAYRVEIDNLGRGKLTTLGGGR